MIEMNRIYNEDCLSGFKDVDSNSIDLIVTDPPYKLTPRGTNESWGGGKSCDNIIGAGVRLPHDGLNENELALLSGPVRTYKMAKEDEKH